MAYFGDSIHYHENCIKFFPISGCGDEVHRDFFPRSVGHWLGVQIAGSGMSDWLSSLAGVTVADVLFHVCAHLRPVIIL